MDISIAFLAGVYVGGLITEVVMSVHDKDPVVTTTINALIWPVNTARVIHLIVTR